MYNTSAIQMYEKTVEINASSSSNGRATVTQGQYERHAKPNSINFLAIGGIFVCVGTLLHVVSAENNGNLVFSFICTHLTRKFEHITQMLFGRICVSPENEHKRTKPDEEKNTGKIEKSFCPSPIVAYVRMYSKTTCFQFTFTHAYGRNVHCWELGKNLNSRFE